MLCRFFHLPCRKTAYNDSRVISMQAMFENVAVLLIFGAIGWFLGKRHILSSQNLKLLSVLEVWVFLPCNSMRSFSRYFTVEYFLDKYPVLIVSALIVTALALVNAWLVPRFVKGSYRQHIFHYALTLPNYGYVGYALVQGVYGDMMLLNAQMFALPMSIYTNTEGYWLLTNSGSVSWRKMLNPTIVAIFAGCIIGLTGWELPSVLASVVDKGSACMGPISMLLAGITISDYPMEMLLKDKPSYLVTGFRLLVIPLVLAVLLAPFLDREMVLVAVLLYACPCGLNTIVYPRLIGEDCRPGASMAMISTVASLGTLPLCMQVLEWIVK